MQQKSLTFITRQAPYGSNKAKLVIDAALAAAVFEQQVNFLFMDDGVFPARSESECRVYLIEDNW